MNDRASFFGIDLSNATCVPVHEQAGQENQAMSCLSQQYNGALDEHLLL